METSVSTASTSRSRASTSVASIIVSVVARLDAVSMKRRKGAEPMPWLARGFSNHAKNIAWLSSRRSMPRM